MRRVCTRCGRVSSTGNSWCQTRDCPSGTLTTIFDHGESLGDIEVDKLLRILRTSAIYEARRGADTVLLKVAHDDCQDQLKREAATLAQLLAGGEHPMLPKLLSPYQFAETAQRPYGKTVFQDETKYYEVFEHIKGEFLRDTLTKNPQPWYQHAAWITISIADAVAYLHIKGNKLHLNLSPDTILVRTDKQGIPRPVLLDLGAVTDPQSVSTAWIQRYALPAYTPPELLERNIAASVTADVYGLGLLMYEMLAGRPAFAFALRKDDDIREDVREGNPLALNRTDLSEDIIASIHEAMNRIPSRRPADVRTFAKTLRTKFGEAPAEKKGIQLITRRQLMIGVSTGLLLAVLIVLGVVLEGAHIIN